MSAAELQGAISACPALCSLDVTATLEPGVAVHQQLLHLPSRCCSLGVGGEASGDDAAANTVMQLTQLAKLNWSESGELRDAQALLTFILSSAQALQPSNWLLAVRYLPSCWCQEAAVILLLLSLFIVSCCRPNSSCALTATLMHTSVICCHSSCLLVV
jgi:hypothetical protein